MGFYRDMYEATGNPWYAWEQYRLSRREKHIPADWVLKYLDEAADALHDLGVTLSEQTATLPAKAKATRQKLSRQTPAHVARALGFNRRGRGNYLLNANEDPEQLTLAIRVKRELIALGSMKGSRKAINIVAANTNQKESTVKDAWNKYKPVVQNVVFPGKNDRIVVVIRKDRLTPQSTE
jgi:hypothetical protein